MSLVFVNGKPQSTVSALDRGLLYGDGLFETVAIVNGKPLLLTQHLNRLEKGVQVLGFNTDLTVLKSEINAFILEISQSSQKTEKAILRVTITRGEQSRGYVPVMNGVSTRILSLHDWPEHIPQSLSLALSSVKYAHQPLLAGLKHSNRLEQVLASQSIPEGSDDVIMLDMNDFVISCSKGNVFFKIDNVWHTPVLDKCGIQGVVRSQLIEWFKQQNIPFKESEISAEALKKNAAKIESVFMCNSIAGIVPIHEFMGVKIKPENLASSKQDSIQYLQQQMVEQGTVA